MITFGLNTAVSVFMAHQEGVMWRREAVRPNYSSLTQHSVSEAKSNERRGRGEPQKKTKKQATNSDRRQIKRDKWQKQEKTTEAVRERKRERAREDRGALRRITLFVISLGKLLKGK